MSTLSSEALEKLRPRRFKYLEIEDIVSGIPMINCVDEDVARMTHESMKKCYRKALSTVVMTITPETIAQYKEMIARRVIAALVKENYTAGINGSTSISYAITQSTFKTIHKASIESGKVEGGIRGFKALLTIQKDVTGPLMIVHFNRRVTKQDVANMRSIIVSITVEQMIQNMVVKRIMGDMTPVPDSDPLYHQRYWWHNNGTYLPMGDQLCARFYIKEMMMYEHKITPSAVAKAIIAMLDKTQDTRFSVIPSPVIVDYRNPYKYGFVDVFMSSAENEQGTPRYNVEVTSTLTHDLRKGFGVVTIKGIPNILSLNPNLVPLTTFLRNNRELTEDEKIPDEIDTQAVDIDYKEMIQHVSVSLYLMSKTLQECGVEVVRVLRSKIEGQFTQRPRPYAFVVRRRNKTVQEIEEELSKRDEDDNKPVVPYFNANEMVGSSNNPYKDYIYATTKGINVKGICRLPWVDTSRIACNDIRMMNSLYGLETTYIYYSSLIMTVLKGISDVSMRHIMLLIDIIFQSGDPTGVSYYGIRARGVNFTQQAAAGSPAAVISSAAIARKRSAKNNIFTSIVQGTLPDIIEKKKIIEIVRRRLEKASALPVDNRVAAEEAVAKRANMIEEVQYTWDDFRDKPFNILPPIVRSVVSYPPPIVPEKVELTTVLSIENRPVLSALAEGTPSPTRTEYVDITDLIPVIPKYNGRAPYFLESIADEAYVEHTYEIDKSRIIRGQRGALASLLSVDLGQTYFINSNLCTPFTHPPLNVDAMRNFFLGGGGAGIFKRY